MFWKMGATSTRIPIAENAILLALAITVIFVALIRAASPQSTWTTIPLPSFWDRVPPIYDRRPPPGRYDHPFNGKLLLQHADDLAQLRGVCNNDTHALGCAFPRPEERSCWILLAPKDDIAKAQFPLEQLIRHEIAHCNGWPVDHPKD
jgi:hypothetical protein